MALLTLSVELIILVLGIILLSWKRLHVNFKVWTQSTGILLIALALLSIIYTTINGLT